MTDPNAWPALSGFGGAPDTPSHRGIWGKVHGESSDYRWIARSAGFAQDCMAMAGALRIGDEEKAVTTTLWRSLSDRWLACSVYPSRARDSAGRLTVIEKQVAEWRPEPGIPAVVGALNLLPRIASRSDQDWWELAGQGRWEQPDYALTIPQSDCPRVCGNAADIHDLVEQARAALVVSFDRPQLERFYLRLLGGSLPAMLEHPSASDRGPSPLALSALLLPLRRDWADRLSLAGAVASARLDPPDILRNWDAYGGSGLASPRSDENPALLARAQTMAEALITNTPQLLQPRARARPVAATLPRAEAPEQETGWFDEPPSPQTNRRPGPRGLAPGPQGLGQITRPPDGAPRIVRLAHAFACLAHERRLDLRRLGPALEQAPAPDRMDEHSRRALRAWPGEVERAAGHLSQRERALKADQLRAIAALVVPEPARAWDPGLPRDPAIPGLLPALAMKPELAGRRLAALGEDACSALIEQSLHCPNDRLRERIHEWLDRWRGSGTIPSWLSSQCLLRRD